MKEEIYDSTARTRPVLGELQTLWKNRALVRFMIGRNVRERYKRSVLGVWWTILNPMLEMGVLYLVFSGRFEVPGVPYVVYLLAGLVVLNLFRDTVTTVATTLLNEGGIVGRIHVPIEILAVAAAGALCVNFLISLVPLAVIMVASGAAFSATAPLALLPAALVLLLGVGLGLALAPLAVTFPDVIDLTRIALTLIGYLSVVFYPVTFFAEDSRWLLDFNLLYDGIRAFRHLLYGGADGIGPSLLVLGPAAAVALLLGSWFYSRRIPAAIAMVG